MLISIGSNKIEETTDSVGDEIRSIVLCSIEI